MHRSAPAKKAPKAKAANKAVKSTKVARKTLLKTQRRKFSMEVRPNELDSMEDHKIDPVQLISNPGPVKYKLSDLTSDQAKSFLGFDADNIPTYMGNSERVRRRLLLSGATVTSPFELDLASDPFGIRARTIMAGDVRDPRIRALSQNRLRDYVTAAACGGVLAFSAVYAHDLVFTNPLPAVPIINVLTLKPLLASQGIEDFRHFVASYTSPDESTFVSRALYADLGAVFGLAYQALFGKSFALQQRYDPEDLDLYSLTPKEIHAFRFLKHIDDLVDHGTYQQKVTEALQNHKVSMSELFHVDYNATTPLRFPLKALADSPQLVSKMENNAPLSPEEQQTLNEQISQFAQAINHPNYTENYDSLPLASFFRTHIKPEHH